MKISWLLSCGLVGLSIVQVSFGDEAVVSDGDRIVPCVEVSPNAASESAKLGRRVVGYSLTGISGFLSYRFLVMSSKEENLLRENRKLIAIMKEYSANEVALIQARSDAARLDGAKRAFVQKHDLLRVSEAVKNSTAPIGPSGLPNGIDPGKLFEGTKIAPAEQMHFNGLVSKSVSALTNRLTAEKRRTTLLKEIELQSARRLTPLVDDSKKLADTLAQLKNSNEARAKGLSARANSARIRRFAYGSVSLVGLGLGMYMLVPDDSEVSDAIDSSGLNSDDERLASALKCAGDYFQRIEEPYSDENTIIPINR